MDKWDSRFMEMAHVIAGWTSCYRPGRSIGCVIVKDKRIMTTGYLPDTPDEQRIDQELAGQAVGVSVRRHAGHVEHVWTTGSKQYQVGKNISEVSEIIGIGGVIVNSPDPAAILQRSALRAGESEDVLIPRELNAHIDRDYVFYAAGLLRDYDEETAMALMKASIR